MVLTRLIHRLTTPPREFVEIEEDIGEVLTTHAITGMEDEYGEVGRQKLNADWDEVERLMEESPGVFKSPEAEFNYNGGLTALSRRPGCTNVESLSYDVNGNDYSIFLIEVAEPIITDDNPFYIVGEVFEFPESETDAKLSYLNAERRDYDTPLSENLER